jgi:signal transduction histidine kinase
VQEAVTNAAKHGKPNVIEIKLGKKNEEMELLVSDDGIGIVENSDSVGGIGMRSMHYRCSLIGARLGIESKPDGGTVVACRLPL